MHHENWRVQRGQTVLEMLIALSIITVGLFAVITLSLRNVYQGRESLNELSAANFAREGIEIVRNLRDSNRYLTTGDWKAGIDQLGDQSINSALFSLESSTDPRSPKRGIRQKDDGSYEQGDTSIGVETKFRRKVNLYPICAALGSTSETLGKDSPATCTFTSSDVAGVQIFVEVSWTEGTLSQNTRVLTVEDRLYNW